jgi:malonyl CoA-acyl carrier protein transacylase
MAGSRRSSNAGEEEQPETAGPERTVLDPVNFDEIADFVISGLINNVVQGVEAGTQEYFLKKLLTTCSERKVPNFSSSFFIFVDRKTATNFAKWRVSSPAYIVAGNHEIFYESF